ncbi:1-acyl-sn-glycerol-3-phosphate acyltransferase [Porphyromonas sp.]|uniref:1-acyl-sn-glycerol-3-phosphate acyltransferase n=1 Tax=Porphyromonas sp. TaxID=1924944 RepID=UPI0026DD4C43|nr:1-acyl-sn-glycerol-3-phosphate acyltransferase [Porphyromonas sp.]MDO4695688.1 1-acyl-sn-glycerol-3-phosphate acyltransferase [Porphyromonas sp.]MDO4771709.1 1-acyl-sn-glycerol-3-phosphate acyltransferase [Porphyromonas sp.]
MGKIDVEKVVRQKYKGYIPHFLIHAIKKLIHQDEINDILDLQTEVDGVSFAHKVMDALDFTVDMHNQELLPMTGRYIFISNHPLGGADGVVLTSILGKLYDSKINFLVNDLLMNISQFGNVFLPINKYGRQSKSSYQRIEEALLSDRQIITFPAGLCSRKNEKGEIRDLNWSPSFIRMARKYQRDIVPIFFDSRNSNTFYKWARWRERMGLKFNYELVLLPDELFKARGANFDIYIGSTIKVDSLDRDIDDFTIAQSIKTSLYSIPAQTNSL